MFSKVRSKDWGEFGDIDPLNKVSTKRARSRAFKAATQDYLAKVAIGDGLKALKGQDFGCGLRVCISIGYGRAMSTE